MTVKRWLTEGSAAFADLGTFLPLVLGMIVIAGINPTGLLYGFGLFALGTALYYRRPIPVQPMKAVAAMAIAGLIGPEVLIATGILLGITLILLSQTDAIGWLKGLIPKTVMHGMRVALAISLVLTALGLGDLSLGPFALLMLLLIALQFTPLRAVSCALILVLGWWLLGDSNTATAALLSITPPEFGLPAYSAFVQSLETAFLPQMALTLTNALILTTVIAQEYFPERRDALTEKQFALSSGLANLLLAPIGAIPMCHGAGGLSAHYGQGSRTGWSIGLFGLVCLLLALLFGQHSAAVLSAIPFEAVTVLVIFAAWYLAEPRKLLAVRPSCQAIIVVMTVLALWGGLMTALVVGIALEWARARYLRPESAPD